MKSSARFAARRSSELLEIGTIQVDTSVIPIMPLCIFCKHKQKQFLQ